MRRHEQLSLTPDWIAHEHGRELMTISRLLDQEPAMAQRVEQDLVHGVRNPHTGARGLSGDQVLRLLLIKQMNGYSYEDLDFALHDSSSCRTFCRIGALDEVPGRSTVAENLKKVSAETLEAINRLILEQAQRAKVESGKKVRVDSTVVESHIHTPSDSGLLYDGVRVLSRLLARTKKVCGFAAWQDHTRRAKRRMNAIHGTRSETKRKKAYRDLLKVARRSRRYAAAGLRALRGSEAAERAQRLAAHLEHFAALLARVIEQTERRVLRGEQPPAGERVVSLFEPHANVIVKDRQHVYYGHKVTLSGGASGMVLDCTIENGNPNDATRALPMLKRHAEMYGRAPRQAAMDGTYASRENLAEAKELGVEDVCFSHTRGLKIEEMARSRWVYRRLRDFRAGVEAMISHLKRSFGLRRCTWRGEKSFASYVWSGIVAANLLTLARHLLR